MATKLRIYVVLSNTPARLNLLLVMSIRIFCTSPWMVCFRWWFVNCCESCTQLIKMLPWILLSKDGCSHLGHCYFNIQLMEFIDRLQWWRFVKHFNLETLLVNPPSSLISFSLFHLPGLHLSLHHDPIYNYCDFPTFSLFLHLNFVPVFLTFCA